MIKFSANLGFLWKEFTLTDAIHEAKKVGFQAVEFHWPYDVPAHEVKQTLLATGLTALGINTIRGNISAGENGLSALPSKKEEACKAIDDAIEYGSQINVKNIHVMAGNTTGQQAHETFLENLDYAAHKAGSKNINVLIEPLNHYDAPGYFLQNSTQAIEIIKTIDKPNLKLMFDCYHTQIMEGDVSRRLGKLLPFIGHIQIAGVPQRGEPDISELDYKYVLNEIERLGYKEPIGVEYKPTVNMEQSLNWMKNLI